MYCQHVLGIGHLHRTLAIADALHDHQVTLMLGGPTAAITPAAHIQILKLPGLQMDAAFSELMATDEDASLSEVKQQRREKIFEMMHDLQPDILMIELFPFGRNGFSFELIPLLEGIRSGELPDCKVVCSLRDILVEKKNPQKFEHRAIDRINSFFDLLLIHGDPHLIPLDATFSRVADIKIPLMYTGYVTAAMDFSGVEKLRQEQQLTESEKLIVVSAGGGNVGCRLLDAATDAYNALDFPARMMVFTGPYLDQRDFETMKAKERPGMHVERFSDTFSSWLGAADLSVSMGGYNTTMNILAAGTPALIFPFQQNREQKMRADRLSALTNLIVLDEEDLLPQRLAGLMKQMAGRPKKNAGIRLDGATSTARRLTQWGKEQ